MEAQPTMGNAAMYNSQPLFDRLPLEIRELIYGECFGESGDIATLKVQAYKPKLPPPRYYLKHIPEQHQMLAIAGTSKLIRKESLAIYYKTKQFVIEMYGTGVGTLTEVNRGLGGVQRWINGIGQNGLELRRIELHMDISHLTRVVGDHWVQMITTNMNAIRTAAPKLQQFDILILPYRATWTKEQRKAYWENYGMKADCDKCDTYYFGDGTKPPQFTLSRPIRMGWDQNVRQQLGKHIEQVEEEWEAMQGRPGCSISATCNLILQEVVREQTVRKLLLFGGAKQA